MKAPLIVTSDCERAPSDSCPARWAMQPEGRTGMCHPHALLSRAMVHWALGQTLLLGPSTEAVQGPRPLLPLHTLSGPAPYPGPQYLPCPWCHVKLCVPGSAPAVCIFLWPLRHNTPEGQALPRSRRAYKLGLSHAEWVYLHSVCLHLRPAACLPLLWEFSAGGCFRHLLHLDDVSGANMAEESFRGQGTPRGVWKIITPGQQGTFI